jgi:hypothetical protein
VKQHSVQKLSQTTITDAIMYLDARFVQPEKLVSVALYDDKRAVSGIKLNSHKKGFQKFALYTSGLITWPSALVDELEKRLELFEVVYDPSHWPFLFSLVCYQFLHTFSSL